MYARLIAPFETISIRVYTGAGQNRPRFDYEGLRARVTDYAADDLVGSIVQGDRRHIVLAEDVERAGVPLPLQTGPNWKVVVRGKELQLKVPNDNTRRLGDVVVAYEIAAGG